MQFLCVQVNFDEFEGMKPGLLAPMNILMCSVPFRPSVGGIETVSALLAEQFARRGHAVTLVTQTASEEPDEEAYRIVRRPVATLLWKLVREADVVFHNNISLRLAWPLLLSPRPWVVAHHTWIARSGWAAWVKRAALRWASNISISRAIADDLPVPSTRVPNPYQASLFRPLQGVARDRDIVFVGRLVSDKGVTTLLDALHRLRGLGLHLSATLIGDGPEAPALREQTRSLGLTDQVEFAGRRSGEDLVRRLHAHHVLVVPSVWEEPFGLVVLEGLACGCLPLVARSGALPEAAGPCGRVFAKGEAGALAAELLAWHMHRPVAASVQTQSAEHLASHQPDRVAAGYLHVLSRACQRSSAVLAA